MTGREYVTVDMTDTAFTRDELVAFMRELSGLWAKRPHGWGMRGGSAAFDWLARAFSDPVAEGSLVIDPEDREQVERLVSELRQRGIGQMLMTREQSQSGSVDEVMAEHVRNALTDLVTPPKPDEPWGLGAVVATEADGDYIRVSVEISNPWRNVQTGVQRHWDGVAATRTLSEGVQP